MVYNYNLRRSVEPWEEVSTWRRFWVRRFFRIAPVYYVCLITIMLFGTLYLQWQHSLAIRFHDEWMIDPLAADSKAIWRFDLKTFAAHATFLFGIFPSQAVTSPLPDWSLGLEAQYYAIFPLAMLFWKRGKWLIIAVLTYMVALICRRLFGLGMGEGATVGLLPWNYPMPSFLGFKIGTFLVGMLLAEAVCKFQKSEPDQSVILLILAGAICGLQDNRLLIALYATLALCTFAAVDNSGVANAINNFLEKPSFKFLGDISYPIYLTHQLVLLPFCAAWIKLDWFVGNTPTIRFLLSVMMVGPVVVLVSYALRKYIEMPGIVLGKKLLGGLPAVAKRSLIQ